MSFRQHLSNGAGGIAGIDEVIDDQPAFPIALDGLQNFNFALAVLPTVAGDTNGIHQANVQFPGDDGRRDKAAAGNGQKRLVEIICGLQRPAGGHISILGKTWTKFFGNTNRDNLLSYIPEDRQGLATCQHLNMLENFLITTRHAFCNGPWLSKQRARPKVSDLITAFDVQPARIAATARQLSGGNLQKLVLAREFFRRPRLIVAEQPTQGLDIGATEEVWNLLLQARERAGILLVTGDLKEALSLADRVVVIFAGKLMDAFAVGDTARVEQIGLLMAGLDPSAGKV